MNFAVEIDENRVVKLMTMFSQVMGAQRHAIPQGSAKWKEMVVEQALALLVMGPDVMRRLGLPVELQKQLIDQAKDLSDRIAEAEAGGSSGLVVPPGLAQALPAPVVPAEPQDVLAAVKKGPR